QWRYRRRGMLRNSLFRATAAFETKSGGAAGTGSRNRPMPGQESAGALRFLPATRDLPLSLHTREAPASNSIVWKKLLVDAALKTSRGLDGGGCRSAVDCLSPDPASAAGPFRRCASPSSFLLSSRRAP